MNERIYTVQIPISKSTVENWADRDITDKEFDTVIGEIETGIFNTVSKGLSWDIINIALQELEGK